MSYNIIARMASDYAFRQRLYACAGVSKVKDSQVWVDQNIWNIIGDADMAAAYQLAIEKSNPQPGTDESVITDEMILNKITSLQPSSSGA